MVDCLKWHGCGTPLPSVHRAVVVAAERYDRSIRDPAECEPFATGTVWADSLVYVPERAYAHVTGEELRRRTRYPYEAYSNTAGWAAPGSPALLRVIQLCYEGTQLWMGV